MNASIKIILNGFLILFTQFSFAQVIKQDLSEQVSTKGIFDGNLVDVGVIDRYKVYIINDYFISQEDLSTSKADSLKGKNILVTGALKIIPGRRGEFVSPKNNTEKTKMPYKDRDKYFITNPTFLIIKED